MTTTHGLRPDSSAQLRQVSENTSGVSAANVSLVGRGSSRLQCPPSHLKHPVVRVTPANEAPRVHEDTAGDARHLTELLVPYASPRLQQWQSATQYTVVTCTGLSEATHSTHTHQARPLKSGSIWINEFECINKGTVGGFTGGTIGLLLGASGMFWEA